VTDDLTGLYNHRYFQDQVPLEIGRHTGSDSVLALLLIDIDDFKTHNELYGHSAGDETLRAVAEVLTSGIRSSDVLARNDGDEFALLTTRSDAQEALELAEQIRLSLSEAAVRVETECGASEVSVTVSIGLALYEGDAKAFLSDANHALEAAKERGKDYVRASWT
jgi:diguanylate cyclase (GGDEF)-like protein